MLKKELKPSYRMEVGVIGTDALLAAEIGQARPWLVEDWRDACWNALLLFSPLSASQRKRHVSHVRLAIALDHASAFPLRGNADSTNGQKGGGL